MRDYVILTDSTADLPAEMADKLGLAVIPMEFSIGDKTYLHYPDGRELGFKEFYDKVREGAMPRTAQITMNTYMEWAEPILKEGKDLLILAFSSALSGTYQSACLAAAELAGKYPDLKIMAVDSRAASMGEGLLAWYAAKKKEEGLSIEELAAWLTDNRDHLCHWFTVDDLNHLKRGGRVSSAAALFGTLLGIKPVLHVDDEGRLIPMSKVRGRRQSLDALADKLEETFLGEEPQTVFISHGDAPEDAEYLAGQVKKRMGKKIADLVIHYIGPVIGAHSGPGTVALFFMGTHK